MPGKHSKLGIASFLIAVLSIAGMIGSAIAASNAALKLAENPNFDPAAVAAAGALPEGMAEVAGYSALVFFFVLTALVGGLLGLAGLFRKDARKLFSVLGLILNAGLVFLVVIIFVIGMLAAPALPM